MSDDLAIHPREQSFSVWTGVQVCLRLVLPVVLLLAVYLGAYLGLDRFITWFDVFAAEKWFLNPGYWLTLGHLVLPLAWLVSNLTNRRYGAGYALAQLLLAWLVLAIAGSALLQASEGIFTASPLPARRISLAFIITLILGQIVGIYVFDRIRGRTWWGAPLFSALWGQSVFVVCFYPMVYAGLGEPWPNYMFMDLGLKIVAAVLMLVPYQLLRPLIRPLPGYGGA